MATGSNQTAGATGPAAPPAAPARNRHSAGIQVDGLGLPAYTSCNELPPMINLVLGVVLGYHIRKLHEPAKPEPYDERESNP